MVISNGLPCSIPQNLSVRAEAEEEKKPVIQVVEVVEEVSTPARDFSGFVESDTAGQQNIYSVEVSGSLLEPVSEFRGV